MPFLNLRKRHRPDSPSVFFMQENAGPTGLSIFRRVKKTATDGILCVLKKAIRLVSLDPPVLFIIIQSLLSRIQVSRFGVHGSRFTVQGSSFRVKGSGFGL